MTTDKKSSLDVAKDLLKKAEVTVQAKLAKTTPAVVRTVDRSMDTASKALSDTLKAISARSAKEQAELLKHYRWFLQKQIDLIDARTQTLRKKADEQVPVSAR